MIKCFFITGTDTNVGKTQAACRLLKSAARLGYRVAGYKPIATGCELTPFGPRHHDALELMAHSNIELEYNQVNPLAFIEPTSPHIASREEGKLISAETLSNGLRAIAIITDWIIVEGAGGWFTPLGEEFTYADWVISEQLPVIMVVGLKLGCINHALLTSLAIQNSNLPLAGWIANHPAPINHRTHDYLLTLQQRLNFPFLGEIPWLNRTKHSFLDNYLNLTLL